MSHYLRVSFRLLDPVFHGRGDGGIPEWPPSPLRAFQALVAAAGQRFRTVGMFDAYAREPLTWLERLGSPDLIAPSGELSAVYRLYVPNNHEDIVAAARSGGNHFASIAQHRVEKDVRSTRLTGGDTIHYLWPTTPDRAEYVQMLNEIARGVTHLGWGTDQAAASVGFSTTAEADRLIGNRWKPVKHSGTLLRVQQPAGSTTSGTLADLRRKFADFVTRLGPNGFKPVPPLSCFDVVGYHSPTAEGLPMQVRPIAAFEIHRTIEDQEKEENAGKSKFRPFHHVRRVATVAGMLRCATASVAERIGWTNAQIDARIKGHGNGDKCQATSDDRLSYLPLPSITPNGVGAIRRVLVVGPPGFDLAPLRRRLNGEALVDKDSKQPVAMLSSIPATDRNVARYYTCTASVWSTVTPVVLPGFDDPDGLRKKLNHRPNGPHRNADQQKSLWERLNRRAVELIEKAFRQAGLPKELIQAAELEYREVGFRAGVDLARRYDLPPLKYPRCHVRVRFPRPIPGPLVVGAGRYRGLGVFAADGPG
jgi:CRISPR-associated protein Csb2